MTSRISRRTAAKLLLSASAIAALPKSAVAKEAPKPAGPALTPSERQKLAKSITQLPGHCPRPTYRTGARSLSCRSVEDYDLVAILAINASMAFPQSRLNW